MTYGFSVSEIHHVYRFLRLCFLLAVFSDIQDQLLFRLDSLFYLMTFTLKKCYFLKFHVYIIHYGCIDSFSRDVKPLSNISIFWDLIVEIISVFLKNKLSYIFCVTKQHEDTLA